MHRVSFIFHLNVFLVSVCARGFGYLLCWPRGRGIGLVYTRRFSFHEFCNFLLFNFLIFIFFGRLFFYPRQLPTPTPTTHTHYPRPLPTTHDPRPTTFSYTRLNLYVTCKSLTSRKKIKEKNNLFCFIYFFIKGIKVFIFIQGNNI